MRIKDVFLELQNFEAADKNGSLTNWVNNSFFLTTKLDDIEYCCNIHRAYESSEYYTVCLHSDFAYLNKIGSTLPVPVSMRDLFEEDSDQWKYFNKKIVISSGYLKFSPDEACGMDSFQNIIKNTMAKHYADRPMKLRPESIFVDISPDISIYLATIAESCTLNAKRNRNGLQVYPFISGKENDIYMYAMIAVEVDPSDKTKFKEKSKEIYHEFIKKVIILDDSNSVTGIVATWCKFSHKLYF